MASETARIIDLQDYRRRRSAKVEERPAPAPQMALVWVPMMAMMPMMPATMVFGPPPGV